MYYHLLHVNNSILKELDVAPARPAFYCHEGVFKDPLPLAPRTAYQCYTRLPMTDHLVTWLDIHMLWNVSEGNITPSYLTLGPSEIEDKCGD